MVRFIHTSDWQLGMTRRYLTAENQARFTAARIDAIRAIGLVAREREAAFVVVAGDVFESNLVDRQLVLRALEAMREADVPFYLLPGNHDPLAPGSVFTSAVFLGNLPENVVVLDGTPVAAEAGVTILSAPWRSKKLTADALAPGYPAEGGEGVRILVGHGQAEPFAPDAERADVIRMAAAEAALASGSVQYIALGDRHSLTQVGTSGRIWYSGAPEPTEYRETDPGFVLDVTIAGEDINVEPVRVAAWRFVEQRAVIDGAGDLARLRTYLDGIASKERTILNLGFEGSVGLQLSAELDALVDNYRPMFAAIERRATDNQLVIVPSDTDFSGLGLSGFAADAIQELAALAAAQGEGGREAREAVGLLYRLARGAA